MNKSDLQSNKTDKLTMTLKIGAGLIPIVGGAISEVISTIIPNQRFERVVKYLSSLDERVSTIEKAIHEKGDEFTDLLEDSIVQASRAFTEERNNYIKNFILFSATDHALPFDMKKKVFWILAELTNDDISVLRSIFRFNTKEDGFYDELPWKTPASIPWDEYNELNKREKLEYDAASMRRGVHLNSLKSIGLISPLPKEELWGVDNNYEYYQITYLGKLLIHIIFNDDEQFPLDIHEEFMT